MNILSNPFILYGGIAYILNLFQINWLFLFSTCLHYTPFKIYQLTNTSKINKIIQVIKPLNNYTLDDEFIGYLYGKWFFGSVDIIETDNYKKKIFWIICNKKFYSHITYKEYNSEESKVNEILFVEQSEPNEYTSRILSFRPELIPTEIQSNIISKIHNFYMKHNTCVALISGKPGAGKTTIAYLLARQFENKILTKIVPNYDVKIDRHFNIIYNRFDVNKNAPLIIIINEIDELLTDILKYKPPIDLKTSISGFIKNKQTWNSWLDTFDYGLYPYVILILTTNKSIADTSSDPSMIREGRINLKINIGC